MHKSCTKVAVIFYGKIGKLGPLPWSRLQEPYSPGLNGKIQNGRRESCKKCCRYHNRLPLIDGTAANF